MCGEGGRAKHFYKKKNYTQLFNHTTIYKSTKFEHHLQKNKLHNTLHNFTQRYTIIHNLTQVYNTLQNNAQLHTTETPLYKSLQYSTNPTQLLHNYDQLYNN